MGFPGGSVVKNLPANARDADSIPGFGRSPEKEMATHSSILGLRCTGKGGNPFKTKQGNRPSCLDQEGRRGPDVVVLGTSVFSSSQTGVSRNF